MSEHAEAIAAQSLPTLNRVVAKAALARTCSVAARQGLSFHLSYIGRDHPDSGGAGFETDAMRQLYDHGYEKARSDVLGDRAITNRGGEGRWGIDPSCAPRVLDCIRPTLNSTKDASIAP